MKHLAHLEMLVISDHRSDTIFALATAPGRAALSVVRLSGNGARKIIESMSGTLPQPRRATLTRLRDPGDGKIIDHAVVCWFPGPHSFTGEDCVELSVHGSRAVVAKILETLAKTPGTRMARAGEFTRRALEHGKIDLIEVEALGDLLSAETEQQRLLGIAGLSGKFRTSVMELRAKIISVLVDVESSLDFSDEQDVLAYNPEIVIASCDLLCEIMSGWLTNQNSGKLLRSGFTVVISGPPNAGKSTLINELAQRDIAIVSHLPGTTRDLLEVQIDLNGYLVNVVDSAGIRESDDEIERMGIRRAVERAKTADLVLWLCDHREKADPYPEFKDLTVWSIATKCDLAIKSGERELADDAGEDDGDGVRVKISVLSGYQVNELLARLAEFVAGNLSAGVDQAVINERHRSALSRSIAALREVSASAIYPEVVATKLREAMFELEVLIGRVGIDNILGEIFSRFCVGK